MKLSAVAVLCLAMLTCASNSPEPLRPERTKGPVDEGLQLTETVYDRGFKGEWQDFGWSRRELNAGQPARVDMSDYGGCIMARPGLSGDFRALFFRLKSAKAVDFLIVAVSAGKPNDFPDVTVTGKQLRRLEGGEVEALISMKELNPNNRVFDRLVFRAGRPTDKQWVEIDAITLWGLSAATKKAEAAKAIAAPARRVSMTIACNEVGHTIPEMVYGIAYYPMYDARDQYVWSMNPPARRWGGNHTSRYNWKVGNAFNTASDWFFKNVSYVEKRDFTWADFLLADQQHGAKTALTVPTIGWVAKDISSYSFPVVSFGQQQQVEPGNPDVGNGVGTDGKPLKSGPPSRTSVAMPPEDIGAWVMKIRERDAKMGQRSVHQYILDNEPELWHVTHRDVHPEPPSYDELLLRNVSYAKAVRAADPEALIAGPASWGWTGYWWSAVDQVAGFNLKPDRRKHGDVPFLAWYLREMKKEEQKSGKRLLD
ncbi:MAG: glycoside hydrolase family 44 protein, partial [Clostridia bacterium]|nr:glycoside hydrolase family 44 protein [Deltaproteobacteria bacterium]